MKYPFIDAYCLKKLGVIKDYKEEWDAIRYMIGGKMFAMQGNHKDGRPILSLKGDPFINITLRETFLDIIPGYYMNKEHWNSVYLDGTVPDAIIKRMIDDSYLLVYNTLTKTMQHELIQKGSFI
jgi:predicted DNA-binding protein (MmcQ/YjbR family)